MKEETIILTGLKMLGVLTLVLMNGLFVAAELAMIRAGPAHPAAH